MHLANIAKEQGAEVGEGSTGKVGVARDRRSWNAHVRSEREKSVGRKGWCIDLRGFLQLRSIINASLVLENFRSGNERKEKRKEQEYSDPS